MAPDLSDLGGELHGIEGFHDHVERAQAAGEVRADLPAPVLSALAWDTWEGALLRMKVEQRVQPLHDTLALLLDHLLRPQA